MAVNLLGSSDARVEYGDIAAIAGLTELTVAITVTPSSIASNERLCGQWGTLNSHQAFTVYHVNTPNLRLIVGNGSGTSRQYNAPGLSGGTLYRIVWRWRASDGLMTAHYNGVDQSATVVGGSGSVASLADSDQLVYVGYEANSGTDGIDADYSEFAIWGEYVPDWVCVAYGKGMSPLFYKPGILYAPLINTSHLADRWRATAGTNTSGTTVSHPSMIYPTIARGIALSLPEPSGTIAATLQKATAALSGVMQPEGAIAATLQKAMASLAGLKSETVTGTAAPTLQRATAFLTGIHRQTGSIAGSLQRATAALSGGTFQNVGAISASLQKATAAAAGVTGSTAGTIAATLQRATAALAGVQTNVVVATLQPARAALSGSILGSQEIAAATRSRRKLWHAYIHSPWWPRHRLAELSTGHNGDRSWASMEAGRAALYVAVNDPAIAYAQNGNMIVLEGPDMPPWAGYIVTDEEDDRSGVIQLSAVSLEELLNGRITHQNEEYKDSIGGAAMLRSVLSGANARNPTGIKLPSVFEFAPEVEDFQVGGESAKEAIEEYCGRNNFEWWLDVQVSPRWIKAVIRLGNRQGIDHSATYHVYQGTHCSGIYKADVSQTQAIRTELGDFGAELPDRNSVARYGTIGGLQVDFGAAAIDGANVQVSRRLAALSPGLRSEAYGFEVMTGSTGELRRKVGREQDRPLASAEMFNLTFFNQTVDKSKLRIGNYLTWHGRIKGQVAKRVIRIKSMQADEELGVTLCVVEVPI